MTEQQLQEMFEFYKRLEGAFPGYDFVDLLKQHRHTGNDFPQVEAGASVAGNDTEVQFNDGGEMGASGDLTFDDDTDTLTIGNNAGNDASIHSPTTASLYITSDADINPWADGEVDIRADNGGAGYGISLAVTDRSSSGDGGTITITAGDGDTAGFGGGVNIEAGAGDGGEGGQVYIQSGHAVSDIAGRIYLKGGNGDDAGGAVLIESGAAEAGNTNGGDITFKPGDGNGTGLKGSVIIQSPRVPSSASDTGTAGAIAWDSSFIYICTATNTWKRAAISTW